MTVTAMQATDVQAGTRESALLVEFRRLGWRALVLQDSGLAPVWSPAGDGADLVDAEHCGCAGEVWGPCRCPDVCLAVALLVDDPAPWRAGWSRADRQSMWAQLAVSAGLLDPWITGTRAVGVRR